MHQKKINQYLNKLGEQVSQLYVDESIDLVIQAMLDCYKNDSKIITTGMGKAGIAMQKFSATLCSLGIPSVFLHAGEAMHGDLGIISKNDVLFVASTSGKTREVLEIADLSRQLFENIKIIGLTSHKDSELRNKANFIIDMGNFEEIGTLALAPTSSILIMLALTDSIAILLSEMLNLTPKDYYLRHHSGYLGKKAIEMEENNKGHVDGHVETEQIFHNYD